MAGGPISAGDAVLNILPKVSTGFASQLSASLTAPISAEAKKISDTLSKSLTLGKVVAIGAFAGIAAAAFKGMGAAVSATQEFGAQVLTLKRLMGGSAEDASRLAFVLGHFGIDAKAAAVGLGLMEKNLANNTAGAKRYGLSLNDASGQQKPFFQLLEEISAKFQALPPGPLRAALAMNVFGRSGRQWIPVLELGSKGLAELAAQADRFGLVLTGDNLEAIHKYALAQHDLELATTGLKLSIGTALMPVLTTFAHILTGVVASLKIVPGPIKAAALAAVGFTAALTALGLVLNVVKAGLGGLGIQLGATTVATEEATVAATGLRAALAGLGVGAVLAGIGGVALVMTTVADTSKKMSSGVDDAIKTVETFGPRSAQGKAALTSLEATLAMTNRTFRGTSIDSRGAGDSLRATIARLKELPTPAAGAAGAMGSVAAKTQESTNKFWANATAALADRDALLGLEGGLLGILHSARGFTTAQQAVSAAQRQVNEDIRKGLKGTKQYRDDLATLRDAQFNSVDANFSLRQSIAQYADQLQGPVRDAIANVQTATDNLNAAEGDSALQAKDIGQYNANVAAARAALTKALQDQTTAEKGLAPEQKRAIDQLDAMFRKAGFTKEQIRELNKRILDYADNVKGVPGAKATKFSTPGLDDAVHKTSVLVDNFNRLHSKTITLGVNVSLTGDVYGLRYVPGYTGVGSRGGRFLPGYAGGAMFTTGRHSFIAGEGNYPTPLGKGAEIASAAGVQPLDAGSIAKLGKAVAAAGGTSDAAAIGASVARELWKLMRHGGGRAPVELRVRGRDLVAVLHQEELWSR